jgi:hypothetical protein
MEFSEIIKAAFRLNRSQVFLSLLDSTVAPSRSESHNCGSTTRARVHTAEKKKDEIETSCLERKGQYIIGRLFFDHQGGPVNG